VQFLGDGDGDGDEAPELLEVHVASVTHPNCCRLPVPLKVTAR
jgi:hypothetical protein